MDVAEAPANMRRLGRVNSIVAFYCEERRKIVYLKFVEFSVNIDLLVKWTRLVLEVLIRTLFLTPLSL